MKGKGERKVGNRSKTVAVKNIHNPRAGAPGNEVGGEERGVRGSQDFSYWGGGGGGGCGGCLTLKW